MLGEVPLLVNIEAAREGLRTPYTSILCRPLFSEPYLRSSALTVHYCWKLRPPFSASMSC